MFAQSKMNESSMMIPTSIYDISMENDNSIIDENILDSPISVLPDSNAELSTFFNDAEPLPPLTSNNALWAMDQFFDYGGYTEFPFPETHNNSSFFGISPQALNSYMPAPSDQGMSALQAHNNSLQESAAFGGQGASAITVAEPSNAEPATGSQKRQRDSADSPPASSEPPQKKPRKQRKKRSKQLTKEQVDEKRQKFLDRNKVAAHKCRQRKKEWTDNLQNKVSSLQSSLEIYRLQIADSLAEIQSLKILAKQLHPGCTHSEGISTYVKDLEMREAKGFEAGIFQILAQNKATRDAANAVDENENDNDNEHDGSQSMSRRSSIQSSRSSGDDHKSCDERHDSGISNMGTPEEEKQKHNTPRLSIDEGVDFGNGQNHYTQMMPNQRLAMLQRQWNHRPVSGPADLINPSTYLMGVSH